MERAHSTWQRRSARRVRAAGMALALALACGDEKPGQVPSDASVDAPVDAIVADATADATVADALEAGDASGAETAVPDATSARPDRQAVLEALVYGVIRPGYTQTATAADELAAAVSALAAAPDAAGLDKARMAWRAVRARYRACSAFGIGPADDLGITAGIIEEPSNAQRLEAWLASAAPVEEMALTRLPANQRGLLTLEYLLFVPGASDADVVTALAANDRRRARYAGLLATEVAGKLRAVNDAWTAYGVELHTAGRGSTVFVRERDAYDALLNKALAVVDRAIDVIRQAAGGPLVHAGLAVTARSGNVSADLMGDLRSLARLYTGAQVTPPPVCVANVVHDINPMADQEMLRTLNEALDAVAGLPAALAATDPAVMNAITALRAVKLALVTGVFSALGISVGFSDNDGD